MAQQQSTPVDKNLFVRQADGRTLAEAAEEFFKAYGGGFALLYSPRAAYLGKLESENHFIVASGNERDLLTLKKADWQSVFEARIFNDSAELRWLNEANGKGAAAILVKDDAHEFFGAKPKAFKTIVNGEEKEIVDAIEQAYLLWGESLDPANAEGWAKFAEARIGSFFVPVKDIKKKNQRAQFRAIEYLGEYEDGNVAVAEERLTSIEIAPTGETNNG